VTPIRILLVYGTTEGHTRDLCDAMAVALKGQGHEVTVRDAAAREQAPDPRGYDASILAASLHVGRYQAPLAAFARAHHELLNAKPSAFVSVSLAAAGENPDDWEGLEQCLMRFLNETMWKPKAVHHAAGAICYSHYDFFKRLALKYIASRHGMQTVTSRDYDLTDYDALKKFALDFIQTAAPR
jgi:menaquinone-dependent protoporphyrinogen oxidase